MSTPACSASQASCTSAGRSRGDTIVQFSLSTSTVRAVAMAYQYRLVRGGAVAIFVTFWDLLAAG